MPCLLQPIFKDEDVGPKPVAVCINCRWGATSPYRKTKDDPLGQREKDPGCSSPKNNKFDRIYGAGEVSCFDVVDRCDSEGWFEERG